MYKKLGDRRALDVSDTKDDDKFSLIIHRIYVREVILRDKRSLLIRASYCKF